MLSILRKLRKSFFLPGKLRTYLAYAFGEIILIVVGILIAVQLGNLNQNRLDRIEERKVLSRIQGELRNAKLYLEESSQHLSGSLEALKRISNVFANETAEDSYAFVNDVAESARMSWGQPDVRRSVYLELLSSGNFSLIQSVEIRDAIALFYDYIAQFEKRALSRVNNYGELAYELVPRTFDVDDPNSENLALRELSPERYDSIAQRILTSDLHRRITPLRNRYQFILTEWLYIQNKADELDALIERALNSLE